VVRLGRLDNIFALSGLEEMVVTEKQFAEFLEAFKLSLHPHYTLTGAADWPLLVAFFSVIVFLLMIIIALIAFVHVSQKKSTDDEFDDVWNEMHRCQSNCLDIPPGRRRSTRRINDRKSEHKSVPADDSVV
jgi:hypothetical protein